MLQDLVTTNKRMLAELVGIRASDEWVYAPADVKQTMEASYAYFKAAGDSYEADADLKVFSINFDPQRALE